MPRYAMAAVIALLVLVATNAEAQWLNYPTPGMPRLPDGKPDLNAPAPRTADGRPNLSGIWRSDCSASPESTCERERRPIFDLAQGLGPADVQMTPWATQIQAQRSARDSMDDPLGYCLPHGTPRINFTAEGFKWVQTPDLILILYETSVMMTFRQVFTDGRQLPTMTEPTWLGYSVGRWESDTLVIETAGLKDGGWLDTGKAHPHSDALRVTERFRRLNLGRMELTLTIDDPKAYKKPWTVTLPFVLRPDAELLEAFCDGQRKHDQLRRIEPAPPEPPSPPVSSSPR